MQKLQELCENQQDILTLQRRLLAATVPVVETEEGTLENGPCQTVEELKEFDTSLENKETRTKMVINTAIYISCQCSLTIKCSLIT